MPWNQAYVLLSYYLLDTNWTIGQMDRVFAKDLGDLGSILGHVLPKTQKIVLDAALHSTQHYKVLIKGKVEQSKEWTSALSYFLV